MAQPMIPRDLLPSDPRFGCGPSRIRREVVASLSEPGSVMGTSHRQPPVRHVVAAIREELTELYNLPTDYEVALGNGCLLYTSPSPRDLSTSRMPSSA